MPIDPLSLAGTAAQVATQIPNALMAHLTNVKNRKFAREQYKTQRQDALADWNMQNAYNSPAAQMARYKDAGLNPNLIYGEMTTAQPVRQSQGQGGQADAPKMDIQNPVMASSLFNMQQAQINQTKEVTITEQERQKQIRALTMLAGVQAGKTEQEIRNLMQQAGFDLALFPLKQEGMITDIIHKKADTHRLTVEASKGLEQIEQIKADTDYTIQQKKIAWESHKGNLKEQDQRINNMASEILRRAADNAKTKQEVINMQKMAEGLDYDLFVKELHAFMAAQGIDPQGPGAMQMVEKLFREDKSKYHSKRFPIIQKVLQVQATDSQ